MNKKKYINIIEKYQLNEQSSFSLVDTLTQTMTLFSGGQERVYKISTAKNGLGEQNMSFKTPRGLHQISEKLGDDLKACSILAGREFTGEIWSEGMITSKSDLVLTRILWLDGLEDFNQNSKSRYIYIHGTNWEQKLGEPHSEGCVRMSNADVIEYYSLVEKGHLVIIN